MLNQKGLMYIIPSGTYKITSNLVFAQHGGKIKGANRWDTILDFSSVSGIGLQIKEDATPNIQGGRSYKCATRRAIVYKRFRAVWRWRLLRWNPR